MALTCAKKSLQWKFTRKHACERVDRTMPVVGTWILHITRKSNAAAYYWDASVERSMSKFSKKTTASSVVRDTLGTWRTDVTAKSSAGVP